MATRLTDEQLQNLRREAQRRDNDSLVKSCPVADALRNLPVTIDNDPSPPTEGLRIVDDRPASRGRTIATLTPEEDGLWYVSEADSVMDAEGVREFVASEVRPELGAEPKVDVRVRDEPRPSHRVLGCINVDAHCGPRWWLVLAADRSRVVEVLMLDGETAREAADRFERAATMPLDRYLAGHVVESGEEA